MHEPVERINYPTFEGRGFRSKLEFHAQDIDFRVFEVDGSGIDGFAKMRARAYASRRCHLFTTVLYDRRSYTLCGSGEVDMFI